MCMVNERFTHTYITREVDADLTLQSQSLTFNSGDFSFMLSLFICKERNYFNVGDMYKDEETTRTNKKLVKHQEDQAHQTLPVILCVCSAQTSHSLVLNLPCCWISQNIDDPFI